MILVFPAGGIFEVCIRSRRQMYLSRNWALLQKSKIVHSVRWVQIELFVNVLPLVLLEGTTEHTEYTEEENLTEYRREAAYGISRKESVYGIRDTNFLGISVIFLIVP